MERVLLAFALVATIVIAIRLVRYQLGRSRDRLIASLNRHAAAAPEAMRILYFTTPECVECRLRQEPALRELEARFGPRLVVDKRDAIAESELARKYRVRTVPTTAVFGADGRLVEINYGFASPDRLAQQLTSA